MGKKRNTDNEKFLDIEGLDFLDTEGLDFLNEDTESSKKNKL